MQDQINEIAAFGVTMVLLGFMTRMGRDVASAAFGGDKSPALLPQTQRTITLVTGQSIAISADFNEREVAMAKSWGDGFARGVAELMGVPVTRIRVPPQGPVKFVQRWGKAFLAPGLEVKVAESGRAAGMEAARLQPQTLLAGEG